MDLRQLEYFHSVAKLSSITRTAEQTYVSQSTVTVAIQKLEEELGVVLLDRSQKQLSLTKEGKAFDKKITDVLSLLQDAVAEIQSYRDFQKGSLKFGVPPMLGPFLLPKILEGFTKRYPGLELSTIEDGSFNLRQLLEKGELDLGIVLYQPSPLLEMLFISKEQFMVCLPPTHPLASCPTLSLDQLRDDPFIMFKESTYVRKVILEDCQEYGFNPKILLSSNQLETMRRLVAKGSGVCFLIEGIARKSEGLVAIPLNNPLYIEFGLAWKKDRYLSLAAQAFIRFITELLGQPSFTGEKS